MDTIVFVDDDSKWIANYKRMLTNYQKELDCVYFKHPEEAMEFMSTHPTKVLVSELDMPVMSGRELFEMVDLMSPLTVKVGITQVRDVTDTLDIFNQVKIYKLILKPFFVAEDLVVPIRAAVEHYNEKAQEEELFQKIDKKLRKLNQETEELLEKITRKKQGHDTVLKAMLGMIEGNLSLPAVNFDAGKRERIKEFCAELLQEFLQYYMYEKKNLIFYLSYLKNKFHHPGKSRVYDIQNKVSEEIPVTVMNRIAYVMFLTGILCKECLESYYVENVLETEEDEYVLTIEYDWGTGENDSKTDIETQKLMQRIVLELEYALSDRMTGETKTARPMIKLYFRREEEQQ